MDVPLDFNKRFICVEHPSISNDSSKLIRTLGDPSDYNQVCDVLFLTYTIYSLKLIPNILFLSCNLLGYIIIL